MNSGMGMGPREWELDPGDAVSHLHLLLQLVKELPFLTGGCGEGGALTTHDGTRDVLNTIIQAQIRTRGSSQGRGGAGEGEEGRGRGEGGDIEGHRHWGGERHQDTSQYWREMDSPLPVCQLVQYFGSCSIIIVLLIISPEQVQEVAIVLLNSAHTRR